MGELKFELIGYRSELKVYEDRVEITKKDRVLFLLLQQKHFQ